MSVGRHYLTLAVGPVQPFIAAARRSHDLWCGSWLLSEVAKAAARALHTAGAELIFPAPGDPAADLSPDTPFGVGNKIVVVVAGDPRAMAEAAKGAARARWREIAEAAWAEAVKRAGEAALRRDQWEAQVDDVLELFAAWAAIGEAGYAVARATAEGLLAARKNSRDFLPAPREPDGYGLPKSSLDGARETVLGELTSGQRRALGLGAGEQLDCPGLVKRLAGPADQFTPLSRIAIDPWVRGGEAAGEGGRLEAVGQALEPLVAAGVVTRVRGNEGLYASLPFDAQLCYRGRLEAVRPQEPDLAEDLDRLHDALRPLWRRFGEPTPYLAILRADGDRMGRLIEGLATEQDHRRLTRSLADFAGAVSGVVRRHRGHCLYAGGDDVLALCPLDTALACARDLHDRFGAALAPVAGGGAPPTLSVGIVVGHFLTPLSRLLALSHQAERLAKGGVDRFGRRDGVVEAEQRDGLGILLAPRSGGPIGFRERWGRRPDARLAAWIEAHAGDALPERCGYQLREAARQAAGGEDADLRRQIEAAELARILNRKRGGAGVEDALVEHMVGALAHLDLAALADEVVLTRRIADAALQAAGTLREAAHA